MEKKVNEVENAANKTRDAFTGRSRRATFQQYWIIDARGIDATDRSGLWRISSSLCVKTIQPICVRPAI